MASENQIIGTLNNIDEIKKIIPQLNFKEDIENFKMKFISVCFIPDVCTAINVINNDYGKKRPIDSISCLNLYYNDKFNCKTKDGKTKELYLNLVTIGNNENSFCFSTKYYNYIIKSLYFCVIDKKAFYIDEDKYYLVYNEETMKVCGFVYQKEIKNNIYSCLVTTISHNWLYSHDESTTTEFVKELRLNNYLQGLYSSFNI